MFKGFVIGMLVLLVIALKEHDDKVEITCSKPVEWKFYEQPKQGPETNLGETGGRVLKESLIGGPWDGF